MSREARDRFLAFATAPQAEWPGNFRDFNGAILRMATLAPGGRITREAVEEEIGRLLAAWENRAGRMEDSALTAVLSADRLAGIDAFDRAQLEEVVRVCQTSSSLSESGRRLFGVSRARKAAPNDADRLRKYLARFGLDWKELRTTS